MFHLVEVVRLTVELNFDGNGFEVHHIDPAYGKLNELNINMRFRTRQPSGILIMDQKKDGGSVMLVGTHEGKMRSA